MTELSASENNSISSRKEGKRAIRDMTVGELMSVTEHVQTTAVQSTREEETGRFFPKMTLSTLRHDAIIQEWLMTYRPNTQENYLANFNVLLEMTGKKPADIQAMDGTDLKKLTKKVMGQLIAENRHYAARNLMNAMKSFGKHNEKGINFGRGEKVQIQMLKTEVVPQPDQIWQIAEVAAAISNPASPRNKALIKTAWVTGLRSNAISSLRCGAIKGYTEKDCPIALRVGNHYQQIGVGNLWCIDGKLAGYGVGYYYTFIAKEAFVDIQEWLEWRKAKLGEYEDKDFLFCHVKGESMQLTTRSGIWKMYKKAVKKAGMDPKTTTFHKLRDAFKSVMIRAGVNELLSEVLMGHAPPSSKKNYFDYGDLKMAKDDYDKANWSRSSTHRLNEVENKYAGAMAKIAELEKRLEAKNATLSRQDIADMIAAEMQKALALGKGQVTVGNGEDKNDKRKTDLSA